jgi:glc operon protein GlcG
MRDISTKTIVTFCLLLLTISFSQLTAQDGYLVNVNDKGAIMDGYDAVAFFTDKKAVAGDQKYQTNHDGATYYFSSEKNKKAFMKNPKKYAPQYGAFCAVSMSMGGLEPTEIETWSVVDGKLYFQRNKKAAMMWNKKGPKMFIPKANKNWPTVHGKFATFLTRAQLTDRMELSLEAVKVIAAAGHKYAKEHRAPGGAIAIVDAGGHLLYLERLDGSFPAAAMVAYEKARTAAMFRFPSKKLEDGIMGGRGSLITVGYNMLRGGLPIYFKGQVVGGIGVSGAASADQDVEISTAGTQAKF